MLADEPTGNLDSSSAADVLGLLGELNAAGRTVVLITHDVETAHRAQRIVRIKDGEIQSDAKSIDVSILETIRSALEAIWSHGFAPRSPCSGILIGIAAVILTVGLGEGRSATVNSAISALGTNLLIVTPGQFDVLGGIQGGFGSASTLTYADAQDLASHTVAVRTSPPSRRRP